MQLVYAMQPTNACGHKYVDKALLMAKNCYAIF